MGRSDSNPSKLSGFYRRSIAERLQILRQEGFLENDQVDALLSGRPLLMSETADKMVENVIGVFGLPLGVAVHFVIDGRPMVVPMVVEEPSVVAAVSGAARRAREGGGFVCESDDPLVIGQVVVVELGDIGQAKRALYKHQEDILNLANTLHPRLAARGGGAKDLELVDVPAMDGQPELLVLNLLVDTCDAMGANLVNTMCEGVESLIEKITGGRVLFGILSNLADRSLVKATARFPRSVLGNGGLSAEDVCRGIILANHLANVDPYRAATHNKGIMNGIDAVALATGNDWRAVEASAHSFAARGRQYRSLTQWRKDEQGDLIGSIVLPIKVGTVGGSIRANPCAEFSLKLLGARSANELARVMAAVGLAQNFAALRALVSEGIQRGHMMLHARSVAAAAGAPHHLYDAVVERLIQSEQVKESRAREIVRELTQTPHPDAEVDAAVAAGELSSGFGKVILIGEHAAVYGSHVVAAPIKLATRARAMDSEDGVSIVIPQWGVEQQLQASHPNALQESVFLILDKLELQDRNVRLTVFPDIPRAMGLGGSAAMAVAIIRALAKHFGLSLTDQEVNEIAYASECLAHGTPSGVDNTVATFGKTLLFKKGNPPVRKEIRLRKPLPMVVGSTGKESLTAPMVAKVRAAWKADRQEYEAIFRELDQLALETVKALESHDLDDLGQNMNRAHDLLVRLGVSSPELDDLVRTARDHGALGAKLTGAGGGGSMVALCTDEPHKLVRVMNQTGHDALFTEVGASRE